MTIETWEPPIDFSEILELLRVLMPDGKHHIDGDQSRLDSMAETYDEELDTVRVARRDDRIVGFSRFKPNPPDADATVLAYLWDVAVHPEYQRQGIGRALMVDLFTECRRSGYKRIWSRTYEDNGPAIALHRTTGFSIIFTKDDSIVWERTLDAAGETQ